MRLKHRAWLKMLLDIKEKAKDVVKRRGLYLLQSSGGEGGRKDTTDPLPILILSDSHSIVQRPVQADVL